MVYEVSVFLFAVEWQLRKWPEKSEREIRWFAPEEAAALVAPAGLPALFSKRIGHVQFLFNHDWCSRDYSDILGRCEVPGF